MPSDQRPATSDRCLRWSLVVGHQVAPAIRRLLLRLLAAVGSIVVPRATPRTPPQRLLVIKPDHLGDVLLATPALHMLRRQHPQAFIAALIGPWSLPVLARNPDIDALLTLPFPGFARRIPADRRSLTAAPGLSRSIARSLSLLQPYLTLLRYALLLRAGRFDTVLLLRDDHWWGAALAFLAGIPRRIGYAVPECHPFLTMALPWNPAAHVTEQALALCAAVPGAQPATIAEHTDVPPSTPAPEHERSAAANLPLRLDPSPADITWAAHWLTKQGITPEQRLVVLHPGTGGATKLWLPERWATVAEALNAQPNVRLLLTGGPGEEPLVQAVATRMRHPPLTLIGSTSVGQLAAVLGRAALVLGVDSGPLHLAVSQRTPSLHLYGPGNAQRFGPWGDRTRHVIMRASLWCSPCGMFNACPRHTDPPECMERIAVEEVIKVALDLLDTA